MGRSLGIMDTGKLKRQEYCLSHARVGDWGKRCRRHDDSGGTTMQSRDLHCRLFRTFLYDPH